MHPFFYQNQIQKQFLIFFFIIISKFYASCSIAIFCPQAYHFSRIEKIIGVEINSDLCKLQQEIIQKYSMSDRVEVRSLLK